MGRAKHIVVTGGAGFIGSHLVERLLAEGEKVIVIDDCSTGSLENLAAVQGHSGLEVLQTRISSCKELEKVLEDAKGVYHLAAAVGVELVLKHPIQTIQTNLHETEVILEQASQHGVPILLTSTSEVYGKSQKEAFSEEDDLLIGPPHLLRWSYACSKLMDEFLALAHAKERGSACRHRTHFQHGGPAPNWALRNGVCRGSSKPRKPINRFRSMAMANKHGAFVTWTTRWKRCQALELH